jgi:hypothetical protein
VTAAPGRAWLVHGLQPVADGDTALRLLADPSFDPRQTVAVEGDFTKLPPRAAGDGEDIRIVEFSPEEVHLKAEVAQPALLVLADAFYPGWRSVAGAVPITARQPDVPRSWHRQPRCVVSHEPPSWRWGARVSTAVLVSLAAESSHYLPARRFTSPRV